jgi:hypothetical protein
MNKASCIFAALALVGFIVSSASADWAAPAGLLYSVDLGGDLDLSDPGNQGNEWMDCGDIYIESAPTQVKNDDDFSPVYTGWPMVHGFQPPPEDIGTLYDAGGSYSFYFDLDATDQLSVEVIEPYDLVADPKVSEVVLEPTVLVMSFDDDGPAGWAVSGDVPTTAGPTHGSSGAADEVLTDAGIFAVWTPPTLNGVRTETALGLAADPTVEAEDDDVDALDYHERQFHYLSVDHEANAGLDPGDIYVCNLLAVGQNLLLALDDVTHIGISDDTDVDAWEFCSITSAKYNELFGVPAPGDVLVGLFSVDQDDPDTMGVDESGGLNPNQVYLTNLVGSFVGLAVYSEDIDALTVPEPATLCLLGLGSFGLIRRRRG